jgi:hypothetical protein
VLIVVLALVIVALALLVASLVIGQSLFAWLSIGVSVLAAIVLVVDVVLRKRRNADAEDRDDAEDAEDSEDGEHDSDHNERPGEADDNETSAERTGVIPAATTTTSGELDQHELDDVEPGEEETDAADLLIVSELTDQVLVVDERPRYHVQNCRWLRLRETLPLPVREARDLGFTPCEVCTPDRKLASRSRRTRATRPGS